MPRTPSRRTLVLLAAGVVVAVLVILLVVRTGTSHRTSPAHPVPSLSAGPSQSPSPSPAAPPSGTCGTPQRLRVMTFNIHSARTGHGVVLDGVAKEIVAAHPDVVLLQEVDQGLRRTHDLDMPAVLGRKTGLHPYFGANVVHHGDGLYGTAILTRFPALTWSNAHLPNRRGMEQRGLLRVSVRVGAVPLTVYDTHLQQTSADMRLTQIKAVKALVAHAPGAVVLGGDLNANPDSPVLAVARTFLADSWTQVGSGRGYTASEEHPGHRIDYVLHNARLTPTAARVLPSKVSDHRSVVVDLDLWPRAGCSPR